MSAMTCKSLLKSIVFYFDFLMFINLILTLAGQSHCLNRTLSCRAPALQIVS
jgi:hypothetical protein